MTDDETQPETAASAPQMPEGVPAERASWLHGLLGIAAPSTTPPVPKHEGGPTRGLDELPKLPQLVHVPEGPGYARMPRPDLPPLVAPHPPQFQNACADSLVGALCKLDPDRNDDWTSQGLPRLDAVFRAHGAEVTREQINASFPGFSRERARQGIIGAPPRDPSPLISDAKAEHRSGELAFQHRLRVARLALEEHAGLGPFAHRVPKPDLRCPLQRRIAATNRMARYRADHKRTQ